MDIFQFLTWLAGGVGSSIAVSWFFSKWSWYNKQSANFKKYSFAVACALVSLAGYAVLTFVPAETLSLLQPYFAIIAVAFGGLFAGNSFYQTRLAAKE
jgi:uncharacterized membrane protein YfcA